MPGVSRLPAASVAQFSRQCACIADNPSCAAFHPDRRRSACHQRRMLAGVGYWVSGGFDYLSASATYDVPGVGDYGRTSAHTPVWTFRSRTSVKFTGLAELNAAYTIRKNVPEVRLQFTVADEHGRLIPDICPVRPAHTRRSRSR